MLSGRGSLSGAGGAVDGDEQIAAATLRANQLRLYFSVFAGVFVNILRRVGLRATALADARPDTIRVRLLKLAARVRITVRRIRLSFASAFPLQDMFRLAPPPAGAELDAAPPACSAPSERPDQRPKRPRTTADAGEIPRKSAQ